MATEPSSSESQLSRESEPECWCLREIPNPREGTSKFVNDGARFVGFDASGPRILEGYRYCVCKKGTERFENAQEHQREREARKKQEWRQAISDLKERYTLGSDIPYRFHDFTLDSSPLAQTNASLIRRLHDVSLDQSWLLWGKHGTGKTGLAVAYAKLLLMEDDPDRWPAEILFRRTPDLFTELRASYSPRRDDDPTESELLAKYGDVGLLVLDDLGAEHIKDTGWLEDRLYQIIGRRHDDESPIFVTSNLSPAELGARIGERIMWRIVEMCGEDNIIEVKGTNQRDPRKNRNGE